MINRIKYCIANFKMNKNRTESKEYIESIQAKFRKADFASNGDNIRMVVCPPFHSLDTTQIKASDNHGIYIGAQNIYYLENGSYTGEISASMIHEIGSKYVIVGHSERRTHFNETNEQINKKIKIALDNRLRPIVCIGESLEQRKKGLIEHTLKEQITIGLNCIQDYSIILAYEPVWAIGTGETATADIIVETHQIIRKILNDIGFDGQKISILYGGSVNRNNAKELIALGDVDGFLIGGASLDVNHFWDIYNFIEESV